MTTSNQNTTATNLVEVVFQEDLTKQGLAELRKKYPKSFALDMSNDDDFKEARKIRTERNKLAKAINDRRISFTGELKEYGDELIEKIDVIYNPIITAFEAEDQRRKEEAARIKAEHEAMLAKQRDEIAEFGLFVEQCKGKDSEYIAGAIESVDLIETDVFHKDVIHEAIDTKANVVETLNEMYQTAKANEKVAAEREALRQKEAEIQKERTIENRIASLRNEPMNYFGKSSQVIQDRITQLENYVPTSSDFEDRTDEVVQLQAQVIQQLNMMLAQTKQLESVNATSTGLSLEPEQPISNAGYDNFTVGQNTNEPLLGDSIKSDVFESAKSSKPTYQMLDVWPTEQERKNSEELDRICDQLEVAEQHIAYLEAELDRAHAA